MPARLDYNAVAPEGLRTMRALDHYVRKSGLEPGLIEFVKLRASLMNGCAYCVDLHAREARAQGETERRLFAVPVWRERANPHNYLRTLHLFVSSGDQFEHPVFHRMTRPDVIR
jgi:AhpD family alkylhydroperoxidase